jgi:paraquat-inducible protein B
LTLSKNENPEDIFTMAKQASKTIIGIFVVSAVILAAAGVIIFGGGYFLKDKFRIVMFFDGSVKGLDVGAPIVFRGVTIGQITDVYAEIRPEDLKTRVPVLGEVFRGTVRRWGEEISFEDRDPRDTITRLIEKGYRAQLQMQSLVTGKLQINTDIFPDTEARFVKKRLPEDLFEIPTIKSEIDKFRETLADLPIRDILGKASRALDGIDKIANAPEVMETIRDLKLAVQDARNLLQNSEQTVGDIRGLVQKTGTKIDPLADNANATLTAAKRAFRQGERTLAFKGGKPEKMADSFIGAADALRDALVAAKPAIAKAEAALENIRSITAQDSPDRHQLNNMLKELSAAARSIRNWASYLERHPEALLRGKAGPAGK